MFTMSVFVKPLMDLILVRQCDRNWSKILCGTIPNPLHDFKVKVTDEEFLYKSFAIFFFFFYSFSFFTKPSMDLNHVWHDN